MRAVGLDVHRDFCEVAIAEEGTAAVGGPDRRRGRRRWSCSRRAWPRSDRVALEVTGNAWEIARIIEPHVARVIVVSPSDTGIRQARAKTDRLDARTLAKLLAAGELDGVWMPDERTRVMRRRLARRAQLVRGAHAREERDPRGADPPPEGPPAGHRPVRQSRAARWLADSQLPIEERETVDAGLRQIDFLDAEIAAVDRLIAADALNWPEVTRLMTVPGVNVIVAATFMAAVGDIRRFPDRRKLVAYLGLDPKVRQSGDAPATHGHISKQGSAAPATRSSRPAGRRPPARPAARLLPAHPRPPRPPDRDRRRRAQARVPVLVPALARRGLRLRPALADRQEDAPPRARRRRPAPARRPRRLVAQRTRCATPNATSPHRPSTPTRTPSPTGKPPADQGGRERDTGARIKTALEGQSRAADHKPLTSALRYVSHSRPPPRSHRSPRPSKPT